jgi:hypothetical protein
MTGLAEIDAELAMLVETLTEPITWQSRRASVMHQRLCVLIRYWLAGVCGLILAR